MPRKPRCVVDTNVLISAALSPGGTPRQVVEWIIANGTVLISIPAFEELTTRFVGRQKFDRYLSRDARLAFVTEIAASAETVRVTSRVDVCPDPDDNRFVELAVDGTADCIVTGNTKDFPAEHAGIPIWTQARFAGEYVRA